MCIIAIKPSSKAIFSDETIKEMFSRNPDGAGAMWCEKQKVYIQKGFMRINEILDFVHSRDWEGIPLILHFRIGTSGLNNAMNCHPYPVGKQNSTKCTCKLAMAHNGILSKYNPPVGSKINDTQVFINTVINQLPNKFLFNKGICTLIEHESSGSRLAFLDRYGNITRFGTWIEDDGYYFSNSSYKPFQYRPFEFQKYNNWSQKKKPSIIKDEELSFDSGWKRDDIGEYDFQEVKDVDKVIDELDQKCVAVEEGYYDSATGDYSYEVLPEASIVYRYHNTLF